MGVLPATTEMAAEYARWFVNRRAYCRQSDQPHRESGRHYYYRPRRSDGGELALTLADIGRHLAGEITIGLYAINPTTQRVKWMAIDADYRAAMEDLLKLQYELGQDGLQAALEQSRRGGHLWTLVEKPVQAKSARRYIRHLASRLSVSVKGTGLAEGIEIFPKQDLLDNGQFGNAIRGPLGIHRAANRRYWFYGAAYDADSQMAYLRKFKRVSEAQLSELIAHLPAERKPGEAAPARFHSSSRRGFLITEYIDLKACRRAGRNWVAQCPSCRTAGRDRGKDNLAISVEEPQKYLCWAGCTREQIRAALGAPLPALSRR
jgi:hypothetical protein